MRLSDAPPEEEELSKGEIMESWRITCISRATCSFQKQPKMVNPQELRQSQGEGDTRPRTHAKFLLKMSEFCLKTSGQNKPMSMVYTETRMYQE